MALGAARRHVDLLTVRGLGRDRHAPRAGFGVFRQCCEIRRHAGELGIAHLILDEGRHHPPGLAHRLLELGRRQATSGEVRSKRAFAILAMTILAESIVAVPQRLSGGRIRRGALREGWRLQERKQKKRRDKSLHGKSPKS